MIFPSMMKFILGELVITTAALETLPPEEMYRAIDRHVCGDWGDLDDDDHAENELALRIGSRLVSVFHTATGTKFFVVTAADRTTTTIQLPADN
jgi:hypothetical protein